MDINDDTCSAACFQKFSHIKLLYTAIIHTQHYQQTFVPDQHTHTHTHTHTHANTYTHTRKHTPHTHTHTHTPTHTHTHTISHKQQLWTKLSLVRDLQQAGGKRWDTRGLLPAAAADRPELTKYSYLCGAEGHAIQVFGTTLVHAVVTLFLHCINHHGVGNHSHTCMNQEGVVR